MTIRLTLCNANVTQHCRNKTNSIRVIPQWLEEVEITRNTWQWRRFGWHSVDSIHVGFHAAMRTVILVVLKYLTSLVEVVYRWASATRSTLNELALMTNYHHCHHYDQLQQHSSVPAKRSWLGSASLQLEAIQRWSAIWWVWSWTCVHIPAPIDMLYVESSLFTPSLFTFPTMTSIKNSFCVFLATVKTYTHTKN